MKLKTVRQQVKRQRLQSVQEYGREFLALLDSAPGTKVTVTDIVQKVVFQDEHGNVVSPDRRFAGGQSYSGEV